MTDRTDELSAIRAIVSRHLQKQGASFDLDTPLVSGGLIDSMSIVDLILQLQDELGVAIEASEVQPEDFDSVRQIAATLDRFRP